MFVIKLYNSMKDFWPSLPSSPMLPEMEMMFTAE